MFKITPEKWDLKYIKMNLHCDFNSGTMCHHSKPSFQCSCSDDHKYSASVILNTLTALQCINVCVKEWPRSPLTFLSRIQYTLGCTRVAQSTLNQGLTHFLVLTTLWMCYIHAFRNSSWVLGLHSSTELGWKPWSEATLARATQGHQQIAVVCGLKTRLCEHVYKIWNSILHNT